MGVDQIWCHYVLIGIDMGGVSEFLWGFSGFKCSDLVVKDYVVWCMFCFGCG